MVELSTGMAYFTLEVGESPIFRWGHIFTKSACYLHYVCQSTHISTASTGWMDFSEILYWGFYKNLLRKPKFSLIG